MSSNHSLKELRMSWQSHLTEKGFVLLPGLLTNEECGFWLQRWNRFLDETPTATVLRTRDGVVYGARNLIREWPMALKLARSQEIGKVVQQVLSKDAGLVRALFFDKPPEQSWALPWHKDLNIAVCNNRLTSSNFVHPTMKHGVPHVEAPVEILSNMLTIRIHLDAMTETNGPLQVLPKTHRSAKDAEILGIEPETILSEAGDVLLMRPLLSHASGDSKPGTNEHRRLLHLEFAAISDLPDGFEWFDFVSFQTLDSVD